MVVKKVIRTAYLAHALEKREYVRTAQKKIEQATGIRLMNPFAGDEKAIIDKELEGRKRSLQEYAAYLVEQGKSKEFVEQDLEMISKSDVVVAFFFRGVVSIGTPCEVALAYKLMNKPVFVVYSGSHIWLSYFCEASGGALVKDVDELIKVLNRRQKRRSCRYGHIIDVGKSKCRYYHGVCSK